MEVLDDAGFSSAGWRELGRKLMPHADLDSIHANCSDKGGTRRCLEEVIGMWKRDGDNPSWKTLAEAVSKCKEKGGKNVAHKLREIGTAHTIAAVAGHSLFKFPHSSLQGLAQCQH